MVSREPSTLGIIARLEEAETIASIVTDRITSTIANISGAEPNVALSIGAIDCSGIDFGSTAAQVALSRLAQAICFTLGNLISGASDTIDAILEKASGLLSEVIGSIVSLAIRIEDSIVSTINGIVSSVTTQLDRAFGAITAAIENVISDVGSFLGGIVDRINDGIRFVLDTIGGAIGTLIQKVGNAFEGFVGGVENLVERLDSTVRNVGEFLVTLARATLDQMSLTVASVLGPLVGAGESVLGRLGDLVESVPGALKDAGAAVAAGVGEFVGKPLEALGTIFVTQIEEFFGTLINEGNLSYGEIIRIFLSRFGVSGDVVEQIASAADEASPTTPGFTAMALTFLIPLILAQFIGAALQPVATQLSQEIAGKTKQALISPTELLDGFFKGDITEVRFREDFQQWGFTEERVSAMVATFRHAPDPSVQIQAWLRDIITENDLNEALTENRMRGNDIELLKQVVFFVPPAQDLIRMAVREVFSPEIRQRFGQDEDFPEEFATFARQQGISDEWARAYWAAHWMLPSPAQGFEMLHRKVIEPEDLDVLLRALDVMPFWRDKLVQIAFSPLTRVDLRRMHALGLLTDKELQTRYEAIGFAPDDAALMVSFTIAFNISEDQLPEELVGLTRASVLNMFEDGIIPKNDAVALITQMGIGEDAAFLYVEQRDMEVSRRERTNLIESIIRLAGGGRIDLGQAEDSLAQLGIGAIEITRAVGRIVGLIDDRDRLPSLAALEKMHKKKILTNAEFMESIKALGFNDVWAGREFKLLTGAKAE